MRKKIVKIVLYVVLIFTIIMFGLYGYAHYVMNYKTNPEKTNNNSPENINPEIALINDTFEVTNKYFSMGYYNKRLDFDSLRKTYLKDLQQLKLDLNI